MALRSPWPMDPSSLLLFVVTALACVTNAATAAITTFLATTVLVPGRIFGLAITASVFEIFAFVALIATCGLFLARVSRTLLFTAWVPGALSCLTGVILSLVTTRLTMDYANDKTLKQEPFASWSVAAAGLAIAIIGLIPQAAFYVMVFPPSRKGNTQHAEIIQDRPPFAPTAVRKSITVHMASLGSKPKALPPRSNSDSPSLASLPTSARSSIRTSITHSVRPVTSKTRLILHTSMSAKDLRNVHSPSPIDEAMRRNDDFGDWDTSSVEYPYAGQYGSKTRARLETIPGSRPVSPAKPLDGPFPDVNEIPTNDLAAPDLPPLQPPSITPGTPDAESSSLKSLKRVPTHRTNSNAADEQAFIHPLFRAQSPDPPPITSPNTVIHASPFAGQIVSPDGVVIGSKMNSPHNSRPTTPVLPVARSRNGSVRSLRLGATSPIEPTERRPSNLGPSSPVEANERRPSNLADRCSPNPVD